MASDQDVSYVLVGHGAEQFHTVVQPAGKEQADAQTDEKIEKKSDT